MKTRFVFAAALLTSVLAIGASPAGAYVRNTAPSIVTVTCSLADDSIYIEWSKEAGKPIKALIQGTLNTLGFGGVYTIPGSRGSKGNWTIPSEFFLPNAPGITDLTSGSVRVQLFNRDLSLSSPLYPDLVNYVACG